MNIAIIGAGIAGVTTAWELARAGHEVTVFERHLAAAEEGSFATGGLLGPGHLAFWSTRLGQAGRPFWGGKELHWLWKNWRASRSEQQARRHQSLQGLAAYSSACLRELRSELEFEFEHSAGVLVLLRGEREHATLTPALQWLKAQGVAHRELNPIAARTIEPALNPDTALHSALHLPDDQAGNCRQFALLLKKEALRHGVQFNFSTAVERLAPTAQGMDIQIVGEPQARHFNAAVLCAGLDSARLLKPLGPRLPLLPVHGYSVSAAVREPLDAPISALLDAHHQISITRLGQRVRVAGGVAMEGSASKLNQTRLQTLYQVLQDWFPGAAMLSNGVQTWKGTRLVLPDGLPLLGPSSVPGLWLNTGHGAHGWALSCGSARIVADLLSNGDAALDVQDFTPQRLQS